jgi:hypothetical protein
MSVTTFVLLFALHDAHRNMIQMQIRNFPDKAACERVGEALNPAIIWNCEPGPPLPCAPPATS